MLKSDEPQNLEAEVPGEQPGVESDRSAQPVDAEEPPRIAFPVVGIGASAGGLEAAIEFFEAMRADSGMAFVLVQHLPPDRETLIPDILSKKTTMRVLAVDDNIEVEPNHVYVIRPGRTLTIRDGHLHLGEPLEKPMHNRPVDDFFRSLAEEQRERSVAIVMSGMGSNGAAGAQAIKVVGGLCIAQDPDSAAYPSMPRHVIDAGYADCILKPSDMPETLLAYIRHPYVRHRAPDLDATLRTDGEFVADILAVLRTRTRHDFSGYKKPTVLRRIQRRMSLAGISRISDYAATLRRTPSEVIALADDLLIHVTGFFRDPEAWEALRTEVIVPLVESRPEDSTIRAWVAACASGEEAYSLAILLVEEIERAGKRLDVRIFATDTAERTLHNARHGVYPGGIESEISPERLERFFRREHSVYHIRPDLRERVIFAPQNVMQDPPFSRLDLVSCRNLLIYLEHPLQQHVLSLLHFGLRDGGTLFLGTSESVGGNDDMFEPIDKKARIFRRIGPTRHGAIDFPSPRLGMLYPRKDSAPRGVQPAATRLSVAQLTNRELLDHHVPAAVTIDRDCRILYYHGDTSRFLRQPSGEPTRSLMSVVHDGVRGAVRAAIDRATSGGAPLAVERAWVSFADGKREHVAVTVSRMEPTGDSSSWVVSFRSLGESPGDAPFPVEIDEGSDGLLRVRDELQSTIEALQASNEELTAAHEEIVSTNEELQSMNEELETSREEMQSLNEELSTVNSQLQVKIEEHEAVSSDLSSLLVSTDIAVLFLDTRFHIRRFTPQVKELLDVIATDIGRPLSDLARKFEDPQLIPEAKIVLERLVPNEREIQVRPDRWFLRRLTPYRTAENRIDGIVVTFIETTERHRIEGALRRTERQFRNSIQDAPIPIIMLSASGEVLELSSAWTELTGYTIEDIPVVEAWLGRIDYDAASSVRDSIQQLFRGSIRSFESEFTIRTKDGQSRSWSMRASSPGAPGDGKAICVGMAIDVTERKRAEMELQSSKDVVEAASAMKDQFLANISHELRTPLSVILMWSKLLATTDMTDGEQRDAVDAIVRSAEAQRRLIEDLLDTTHIVSGKLRVSLKPVELNRLVRSAVDDLRPHMEARNLSLQVELGDPSDIVLGDVGRLEQVIWILLNNAVKFTPKGGSIEVATLREDESVLLRVRDTGIGIPDEFLPRIFQPFVQAEDGKTARSGLGLGLSIARSLVHLHGGTISALSGGPEKGTTLTVRLPRYSHRGDENAADSGFDGGRTLAGVTVLVIDDNVDTLSAVRASLESAGARVECLDDASSAVDVYRRVAPHVVVSDLNMPGCGGFELIGHIRRAESEDRLEPARAIALTAMVTPRDRAAAIAHGFDTFLAKPLDPETLIAETHALLHSVRE